MNILNLPTSSKKLYKIHVGFYTLMKDALNASKKLKLDGFGNKVIRIKGGFRLEVGIYTHMDTVNGIIMHLKNAGYIPDILTE